MLGNCKNLSKDYNIKFTHYPKSDGYNFGSDHALKESFQKNIFENVSSFKGFILSNQDLYVCINDTDGMWEWLREFNVDAAWCGAPHQNITFILNKVHVSDDDEFWYFMKHMKMIATKGFDAYRKYERKIQKMMERY